MRALRAAFVYFAIVFAAGFLLGAVRTLVIAPRTGAFAAVTIELPVMFAVTWFACGWCLSRFGPLALPERAAMGMIAFVLLMTAELSLSLALGASVSGWAAGLLAPPGMLGLAGQLVFAAMPAMRR